MEGWWVLVCFDGLFIGLNQNGKNTMVFRFSLLNQNQEKLKYGAAFRILLLESKD